MKMLRDDDADLSFVLDKTVAIIGYGNQGRAQSLNLRDSGITVVIGAIRDQTAQAAEKDGFEVLPIADAVARGDAIALLIPDEIQPKVYEEHIVGNLRAGNLLDFAHGYNIHFGLIEPPKDVDVVMVAPRMLGEHVRASYEEGRGAPAYIAVAQDATGHARDIALAMAKGIGATRAGVLETSFAHETELDLFTEQATWPLIIRNLILSYETLVEAGFPPEMVALELYGSGEASEVFRQMARRGIFGQMQLHSQTSQYGTLSRGERMLPDEDRARFETRSKGSNPAASPKSGQKSKRQAIPTSRSFGREHASTVSTKQRSSRSTP